MKLSVRLSVNGKRPLSLFLGCNAQDHLTANQKRIYILLWHSWACAESRGTKATISTEQLVLEQQTRQSCCSSFFFGFAQFYRRLPFLSCVYITWPYCTLSSVSTGQCPYIANLSKNFQILSLWWAIVVYLSSCLVRLLIFDLIVAMSTHCCPFCLREFHKLDVQLKLFVVHDILIFIELKNDRVQANVFNRLLLLPALPSILPHCVNPTCPSFSF